MGLKIYSAAEHTFQFGAINIETGRGPDEFASWEQNNPSFTAKAGVDGEVTRSESKDKTTKVKLTLMQTSSSNTALSAIHTLDTKVAGGSGVAPLLIRDRQGVTVFAAVEAWIVKPPAQKRGKEVGTLEWEFECASPMRIDGGN